MPQPITNEIKTIDQLLESKVLLNATVQSLDLTTVKINWDDIKMANTTFLGCEMNAEIEDILRSKGATIFPKIVGLPYNPYRKNLYTPEELMEGYNEEDDRRKDLKIYNHFSMNKFDPEITEALAQRIHDHAIDDALRDLLDVDESGQTKMRCVGVMGGHNILRTDPFYSKTVFMSKKLTELGYVIMSGGGPGIMEAANFGAYFAGKTDEELQEAIDTMKVAPNFKDKDYIKVAQAVINKHPEGHMNIAIPTWFYGHEPTNLFAPHTAKYFSNAIREDVLLAYSTSGIIFAPGSAGTVQEIFTDAAQNHYASFGHVAPMIFLGKEHWSERAPVYQLVEKLSEGLDYHDLLFLTDEGDEIIKFIQEHPTLIM